MAEEKAELSKDEVKLAKRLFYMGFFGLPLLWLLNVVTFRDHYKYAEGDTFKFKKYIQLSGVFFAASMVALLAWIIVFQLDPNAYENLLLVEPDNDPW